MVRCGSSTNHMKPTPPHHTFFDPTNKVEMTLRAPCYTGLYEFLEVSAHDPDIHDEPGIYLQKVEGCGYDVWELTAEEADALAVILAAKAKETRAAFKGKTK